MSILYFLGEVSYSTHPVGGNQPFVTSQQALTPWATLSKHVEGQTKLWF